MDLYFTPVQKETLELIRKFRSLRYDQIQTLMDRQHGKKVRGIKAILRQLEQEKLVEWHGNILYVAGKPLRADISAATDIMLRLTGPRRPPGDPAVVNGNCSRTRGGAHGRQEGYQ